MADTVNSTVIIDGDRNYVIHMDNVSDGTGESAVTKIDISTLTLSDGTVPSMLKLMEVQYAIQGFTYVQLLWDATTDDEIVTLPTGSGVISFDGIGGKADPQSTGTTGDVMLTTAGAASGASYDITAVFKKKA